MLFHHELGNYPSYRFVIQSLCLYLFYFLGSHYYLDAGFFLFFFFQKYFRDNPDF